MLIVNSEAIALAGLTSIFQGNEKFDVIGKAENGSDAILLAKESLPDLALVALNLPKQMDGYMTARRLTSFFPTVKILLIGKRSEHSLSRAYLSFACGAILNDSPTAELLAAAQIVAQGHVFISNDAVSIFRKEIDSHYKKSQALHPDINELLTAREKEIAGFVAKGLNNRQISERLNLSLGTVRNYVSTIISKTQMEDRTQFAIWAITNVRQF